MLGAPTVSKIQHDEHDYWHDIVITSTGVPFAVGKSGLDDYGRDDDDDDDDDADDDCLYRT